MMQSFTAEDISDTCVFLARGIQHATLKNTFELITMNQCFNLAKTQWP